MAEKARIRRVRFWFEGLAPEALAAYRALRTFGFTRDAVNYMMVGVLYAMPEWGRCEMGPDGPRYRTVSGDRSTPK